ncbi:MAG: hypothetical protein IJV18_08350 [Acidaminococcaceae bacterium]|nr:hypothetical protein [Acidaminococcaceae bacterium]MBQ9257812.1 hypothetical protein [Acidaminococcaceae bacterium]
MEETTKKDARAIARQLIYFDIWAEMDDKGNIVLPDIMTEEGKPITLPPDKMERLLNESCKVSVSFLKKGVFDSILKALYMMRDF